AEEVAPVTGVARKELGRRRRLEWVVGDAPEPDADVGDVVAPAAAGDASRFEGVGGDIEWRADPRAAGRAGGGERHDGAAGGGGVGERWGGAGVENRGARGPASCSSIDAVPLRRG